MFFEVLVLLHRNLWDHSRRLAWLAISTLVHGSCPIATLPIIPIYSILARNITGKGSLLSLVIMPIYRCCFVSTAKSNRKAWISVGGLGRRFSRNVDPFDTLICTSMLRILVSSRT